MYVISIAEYVLSLRYRTPTLNINSIHNKFQLHKYYVLIETLDIDPLTL